MEKMIKTRDCADTELSIARQTVLGELSQTSPYLNLLHQQLAEALKDTEAHIAAITHCLHEISLVSLKQKAQLSDALRETEITDAISELDDGNRSIFNQLSEALGHLQFQDVFRQRVEQVQSAILELDQHFAGLYNAAADPSWDGVLSPTLKERMDAHFDQYVMESQREVFKAIKGDVD